jgi:hypothetical protein
MYEAPANTVGLIVHLLCRVEEEASVIAEA